jgi:alpha-galactosidase
MSLYNQLAPTPPMGWNSWDCFGPTVREDEVKANANFMAAHLLKHGWQYIVVDIQWYEPEAKAGGYRPNAFLVMDEYGRLLPAENRFPSAANGGGYKPLADYIHSKGLKFGIHIVRGIPRQAVKANSPIFGTAFRAQDIADVDRVSSWIDDMYGIDMSKPGAQAYYDSIVALYRSWDVDYIKADDMLWPYHKAEIEGLSDAIKRSGRDMVLSLSPGVELSISNADHLQKHSELWRISADFWDRWEDLRAQFDLCKKWEAFIAPNAWPDADMLPLGHIGIRAERGVDRQSLLTTDEQITLMTLWAIFRSPLMFGGDLPSSDEFTIGLLTNDEVLQVNQASCRNRELLRQGNGIVWIAEAEGSDSASDIYLALFNIGDSEAARIEIDLSMLGAGGQADTGYVVRDLWSRIDIGTVQGQLAESVAPHAAKLLRLRLIA